MGAKLRSVFLRGWPLGVCAALLSCSPTPVEPTVPHEGPLTLRFIDDVNFDSDETFVGVPLGGRQFHFLDR